MNENRQKDWGQKNRSLSLPTFLSPVFLSFQTCQVMDRTQGILLEARRICSADFCKAI